MLQWPPWPMHVVISMVPVAVACFWQILVEGAYLDPLEVHEASHAFKLYSCYSAIVFWASELTPCLGMSTDTPHCL